MRKNRAIETFLAERYYHTLTVFFCVQNPITTTTIYDFRFSYLSGAWEYFFCVVLRLDVKLMTSAGCTLKAASGSVQSVQMI